MVHTLLLAALLPSFGVWLDQEPRGGEVAATAAVTADESWDDLTAEYEKAVVAYAEAWAARRRKEPGALPGASPAGAFWARYEAQAARGDDRATLWLLRNVQDAPKEGPARAEHLGTLLAKVQAAGTAAWVAEAIPSLVIWRGDLDGEALESMLGTLALAESSPEVRRAALLGLAEIVAEHDAEEAFAMRLNAFATPGETLDPTAIEGPVLDSVAGRVQETLEQARSKSFEESYVPTDDGYFSKPGAPPTPEALYSPVLKELARRGSVRASVWLIGNTWATDEAAKALLEMCLDVVSKSELDPELLGEFSWRVSSLVNQLGAAAVEPKVRAMLEKVDEKARVGLLYSLGMGLCESGQQDPALREKGLAVLREVVERWPDSKEAERAEGQVFRYTNLLVGQHVPDFEATDVDGHAFHLADYEGKVTVIDFWGFW
jgi:hypothetical protein